MRMYVIEVENTNDVISQIKEKMDEFAFNEEDDEYSISIIINTLSLKDNKILEVYEQFVFSEKDYKVISVQYNLIHDYELVKVDTAPYVMILGDVNESMTIMSPINVKVIGDVNGNLIISNDKCYAYANHFVNANVIFNSTLKHIENEENLKVFAK